MPMGRCQQYHRASEVLQFHQVFPTQAARLPVALCRLHRTVVIHLAVTAASKSCLDVRWDGMVQEI